MLPDVGIDGAVYDSVLHRVAGLRWLQCVVLCTYHMTMKELACESIQKSPMLNCA